MKALTRHIISSRCFLNVHIPWHSRHDNGAANYDIEPVAGWTLVVNRSCLLLGGVTCDGLEGCINAISYFMQEALHKGRGRDNPYLH
eukprot:scaffold2255_cov293-Chaetoceros_neogracile.AAC.14